jgi:hypothetical protein
MINNMNLNPAAEAEAIIKYYGIDPLFQEAVYQGIELGMTGAARLPEAEEDRVMTEITARLEHGDPSYWWLQTGIRIHRRLQAEAKQQFAQEQGEVA